MDLIIELTQMGLGLVYKVNKVLHHKTVTNTNYKSEKKNRRKIYIP